MTDIRFPVADACPALFLQTLHFLGSLLYRSRKTEEIGRGQRRLFQTALADDEIDVFVGEARETARALVFAILEEGDAIRVRDHGDTGKIAGVFLKALDISKEGVDHLVAAAREFVDNAKALTPRVACESERRREAADQAYRRPNPQR